MWSGGKIVKIPFTVRLPKEMSAEKIRAVTQSGTKNKSIFFVKFKSAENNFEKCFGMFQSYDDTKLSLLDRQIELRNIIAVKILSNAQIIKLLNCHLDLFESYMWHSYELRQPNFIGF